MPTLSPTVRTSLLFVAVAVVCLFLRVGNDSDEILQKAH